MIARLLELIFPDSAGRVSCTRPGKEFKSPPRDVPRMNLYLIGFNGGSTRNRIGRLESIESSPNRRLDLQLTAGHPPKRRCVPLHAGFVQRTPSAIPAKPSCAAKLRSFGCSLGQNWVMPTRTGTSWPFRHPA